MTLKSTLITALAALSSAAPASYGSQKALYFLNNDPAGSQLASVPVGADGSLSKPTFVSTGGKGMHAVNATDGSPLGPDSLTGQNAVAVGKNYVFTVNAGSNTVAMFKIDPSCPTEPKLVGKPVDSLGEFPVSITYSSKLETACVLNGGKKNGIACYSVSDAGLKPLDSSLRSLSPYLNTTTPPQGPPRTASQIEFSPESDILIADIKGDSMPNSGNPGTFFVYPVSSGKVSQKATVTQVKDMTGNFGFAFTGSSSQIFVSDVGYGGSLLSISPDGKISETSHVTGKVSASCWGSYSKALNKAYASQAGEPALLAVDVASGKFDKLLMFDSKLMGALDTVVEDKTAYFLGGSAALGAVDLESGSTKQILDLSSGFPPRANWQGLAMYGRQ